MRMKPEQTLAQWIGESRKTVFFGGAGTSTESGIPDFTSAAGLYRQEEHLPYPPEVMLSRTFFLEHPAVFFDFYRRKMLHPAAEPNGCHRLLARLEKEEKLQAIVTQNIDGLHQKAGSSRVLELHGSVHRNYCMKCARFYNLQEVMAVEELVPRCPHDGAIIKPDVVLYEEDLNQRTLYDAIEAISQADLLIIGGTSLTVHPAASLVMYFQGTRTVLINADPTPYDAKANLLISDPIGQVMERVADILSIG